MIILAIRDSKSLFVSSQASTCATLLHVDMGGPRHAFVGPAGLVEDLGHRLA